MKIRFKLIPFLISLAIVLGITFFICWYSYKEYPRNKSTFLDKYFFSKDYEDHDTTELIERYVKMQYKKYVKGTEKVSIINPKTGEKITSSNENPDVLSFKDGTIHVPNYFDIDIYATHSVLDDEEIYNYYFFFYNINYHTIELKSPSDLQLIVVDGTGRETSDFDDADKKGLDLLDLVFNKLFDEDADSSSDILTSTTLGTFAYYNYNSEALTSNYPIFDKDAVYDDENENTKPVVFVMGPKTDNTHTSFTTGIDSNGKEKATTGEITFTLVDTSDNKNERLFTGQITSVKNMADLKDYKDGLQGNILASKDYVPAIIGKLILHGSIAFVLSGIIAFLFYLIWMDPAEPKSKQKQVKQPKQTKSKK